MTPSTATRIQAALRVLSTAYNIGQRATKEEIENDQADARRMAKRLLSGDLTLAMYLRRNNATGGC
jgi:hypothetical protein